MVEFADLGEQCRYVLCKQQTFTPFECRFCGLVYCKLHQDPDKHECRHISRSQTLKKRKGTRCLVRGCSKTGPALLTCSKCLKQVCAEHRHYDAHKCPRHDGYLGMLDKHEQKLKEFEIKIEQWQQKHLTLSQELSNKSNTTLLTKSRARALRQEIPNVYAQLIKYKTTYTQLQKEYNQAKRRYENYHAKLSEKTAKLQDVMRQKQEMHDTHVQRIRELKDRNDALCVEKQTLEKQYNVICEELKTDKFTLREQEGKIQTLLTERTTHTELNKQYSVQVETYAQVQIQRDDYCAKLQKVMQQITELKARTDALSAEKQTLQKEYRAVCEELKNEKSHLREKKQQIERLLAELTAHNEVKKQYTQMQKEYNQVQLRCDNYQAKLSDKTAELLTISQEKQTLQDRQLQQTKQLSDRIDALCAEKKTLDAAYHVICEELKNEKSQLCKKEEKVQMLLGDLKTHTELKKQYSVQVEKYTQLHKEHNQEQLQCDDIRAKLQQKQAAQNTQMKQIKELKDRIDDLCAEKKTSNKEYRNVCEELKNEKSQLYKKEEKVQTLLEELNANKTLVNQQKTEIGDIKEQLKQSQSTVCSAQSLNENLLHQVKEFTSTQKEAEVQQLNSERAHHNEVTEWKNKYAALQKTSNRLETEIESLKKLNGKLALENGRLSQVILIPKNYFCKACGLEGHHW
eukprot:CAMPEP_0202709360 /NCGR_PEP_ID=MMETSP1385-20130828/21483_1 /ASSEMBLY_ACC=CAM_ASM_000861 /TAXON_ID=933848 /ORGANISM="Elphidium margaritaceum" /LENGTH=684 /DNA_ID=CAMNT_0049368609 /DNA_START=121 /DNA_END=2172 /DNA_ORIENTATION=+